MENYKFEEFEEILNSGYQVYFTYLTNRYLLFKTRYRYKRNKNSKRRSWRCKMDNYRGNTKDDTTKNFFRKP